MKRLKKWFKCGNDCEKCQFCWEEKTSYEYDEWDCGCYIKGSDFDEKPCYLINPFCYILGKLKLRKYHYYESKQWDGIGAFYEKEEYLNELLTSEIIGHILKNGASLCFTDKDGQKTEYVNPTEIVKNDVWEIRSTYDKELLPDQKSLKSEWIELLERTWQVIFKKIFGKIIPYIVG